MKHDRENAEMLGQAERERIWLDNAVDRADHEAAVRKKKPDVVRKPEPCRKPACKAMALENASLEEQNEIVRTKRDQLALEARSAKEATLACENALAKVARLNASLKTALGMDPGEDTWEEALERVKAMMGSLGDKDAQIEQMRSTILRQRAALEKVVAQDDGSPLSDHAVEAASSGGNPDTAWVEKEVRRKWHASSESRGYRRGLIRAANVARLAMEGSTTEIGR